MGKITDSSYPIAAASDLDADDWVMVIQDGVVKRVQKADIAGWIGAGTGSGDVTLTGTQTLTNKTLTTPVINDPVILKGVTIETTVYRLASSADASQAIVFTNAASSEFELPSLAVGTEIDIIGTAGLINITAGAGQVVNGTPGLVTRAQYSRARAFCYATDKWIIDGDLEAAEPGGGGEVTPTTGNGYVRFFGPHTASTSTPVATGIAGNYLSVANGAFTDLAGDASVALRIAPGDSTPTATSTICGVYDTTGNQRGWELRQEPSGAYSWQWSSNGTSVTSPTGGMATSSLNLAWMKDFYEWFWLLVTHDVDDGAGGSDVRFWTSRMNVETPDLVTDWVQLGSTQHFAYTTALFASTAPLTIGQRAGGTTQPWKGRVKAFSMRSGIGAAGVFGGTQVVGWDTTDIAADPAATFTAGSGHTVTVNRTGAAAEDTQCVPNTTETYTQFLNGLFPIGAFLQDATSSTVRNNWATRLINTFVMASDQISDDPTAWSDAVQADGRFKQIRHPKGTIHATTVGLYTAVTEGTLPSSLLAFMGFTEPDTPGRQVTYQSMVSNYTLWKAAKPTVPVMVMTTGSHLNNDVRYYPSNDPDGEASHSEPWYGRYYAATAADWVAASRYPVHAAGAFSLLTDALDRVGQWQRDEYAAPMLFQIESSDQDGGTGAAAPTAAQVRGQLWAAICRGVRGISYFPQQVTPTYIGDNTPSDVATMMPTEHAKINTIAGALQGPICPTTCAVTCSDTTLMRRWMTNLTHHVFIVHNFSASAINGVTVKLHGIPAGTTSAEVVGESRSEALSSGSLTDDFPAYTSHIYRVPVTVGGGGGGGGTDPPPPTPTGNVINVAAGGSIASAITIAQPGDTVLVANGTYPPLTTAKVSSGLGVTIKGASRAGVVIQGIVSTGAQYLHWENFTVAGTIAGAANTKSGIFVSGVNTHHQTFKDLDTHVTSGSGTDSTPQFAFRSGCHDMEVSGCNIDGTNAQGGQSRCILIYGPGDVVSETNYCHDINIHDNTLGGADADAIFMMGMWNVFIRNNTFTSIAANADHNDHIQLLRGWHDIWIEDNLFTGQCDQSIQINGKNASLSLRADGLHINRNRASNVVGNGLSLGGAQSGEVKDNDWRSTGVGAPVGTGTFGLVLWGGQEETGAQGAPAGSLMDQNRNMVITGNLFRSKFKYSTDVTGDGVNGNVISGNDISIGSESPGAPSAVGTPPAHPIAVQGPVAAAGRYVLVTWDRNDVTATGYQVFRDGVQIGTRSLSANGAQGMCSFKDSTVTAAVHTYTVKAVYAAGVSVASRAFTIDVLDDADFGSVFNVDSQAGATDLAKAQAAVNAADAAGGGIVQFAARTYTFSGALVMSTVDKVILRGAGMDQTFIQPSFAGNSNAADPCNTANVQEELFFCDGPRADLSPRLTAAIAPGDRSATFTTVSGFSVGQVVYFDQGVTARSPQEFDQNLTSGGSVISPHVVQDPGTPNDQRFRREANEIVSIAGTTVTFRWPFIHAYTTTVVPEHITAGNRNRFELLTVQGTGTGNYFSLIYLDANHWTFADVRFRWSNRNVLQMQGGYDLNVVGCTENNVHANGLGGICKYKFSLLRVAHANFIGNTFGNVDGTSDHSLISVNQSARLVVRGNTFYKSDTYSFDSHGQASWEMLFENNTVNDNFSGVRLGNPDWGFSGPIIVRNNLFANCGRDIELTNNSWGLRLLDNVSTGNKEFVVFAAGWDNATDTPSNLFGSLRAVLKRNRVSGALGVGYQMGGNDGSWFQYVGVKDIVISDNNFVSVVGSAIAIAGTSTQSQRFQVFNNTGKNGYTKPAFVAGDYWAGNADGVSSGSRSPQTWEAEAFGWEQYDGAA